MPILAADVGSLRTKRAPGSQHAPGAHVVGNASRLGLASAVACTLLISVYAAALVLGIGSLATPSQPIGDPYFTVLELLILVIAPVLVVLMGAIHAWAPIEAKATSLLAVVFASLLAGVTCSVHFVILAVGRHATASSAVVRQLSFTWPSAVYALEVLAWDVFFALAVLFAAQAFKGSRVARWIRALLLTSGALSLAGLSGIAFGDMRLRMIGVVGYVGVFPVATVLIAVLFRRPAPLRR